MAQPGSVPAGFICLHGPACALVGATATMIENFDEKPVTTVGFVVGVAVSRDDQRGHVDLGRADDDRRATG